MGITNENVSQTFTATAGQTVFIFSLNFFATSTIKVKKNGTLLNAPEYSLGSLLGSVPYTGGTITLTTGASLDDSIEIYRDVSFTIDQFLALNDIFAAKAPAIQEQLDKLVLMIQEAKYSGDKALTQIGALPNISLPVASADKVLKWNTLANALENAAYCDPARVSTLEAGLSTTNTNLGNLTTRVGSTESAITNINASLTKINEDLSPIISDVSTLKTWRESKVDPYIDDLRSRISLIEKFFGLEGTVDILNNQVVPVEIPAFSFDGNVHTSVRLDYEITRNTGSDYRSSTGTLHLCFKPNKVWEIDRGVNQFDVEGINFTITTIANDICKVYYVSDNILGGGYTGVMKYRKYTFGV